MAGQASRFCLLFSVVFCAIQVFIMIVHADPLCFAALACQPCSDCILTSFYSNPTSAINVCIQYFAYIENKWSSSWLSCQTPTLGCPKDPAPFVRIVWSDTATGVSLGAAQAPSRCFLRGGHVRHVLPPRIRKRPGCFPRDSFCLRLVIQLVQEKPVETFDITCRLLFLCCTRSH